MIFNTIYYQWNEIKLKHPIIATVMLVNRQYYITNKSLNIDLKSTAYDSCEVRFQDELDSLYEEIGLELDENLIESARVTKQKILWHVGL